MPGEMLETILYSSFTISLILCRFVLFVAFDLVTQIFDGGRASEMAYAMLYYCRLCVLFDGHNQTRP